MRKIILQLRNKGLNNDSIYQILASNADLFGIAFFGHKGSKKDKAKLRYIWKTILTAN